MMKTKLWRLRRQQRALCHWVLVITTGLLVACGGGGGSGGGGASEPPPVHTLEDIAVQVSLFRPYLVDASWESIYIYLSPFVDHRTDGPYDCTDGGDRTRRSIEIESIYQPGVPLSGDEVVYDHCAPAADEELHGRYQVAYSNPGFILAGDSPDSPLSLKDAHGSLQIHGKAEQCNDCTNVNGVVTDEMRIRLETRSVEPGGRFVIRYGTDDEPFVLRGRQDTPAAGQFTVWTDGVLEARFGDCQVGPARLRVLDEASTPVLAGGRFISGEVEVTAGATVATVHYSPGEITVVSAGDSQTFTDEQVRLETLNRCPGLSP